MGHFCNKNNWLKKSRFQRNPETWRAKTQSLAPITQKTVMKFLHMAKLAVFWDLVMHCKLFYDENYLCNASFFADSRILKPCARCEPHFSTPPLSQKKLLARFASKLVWRCHLIFYFNSPRRFLIFHLNPVLWGWWCGGGE